MWTFQQHVNIQKIKEVIIYVNFINQKYYVAKYILLEL